MKSQRSWKRPLVAAIVLSVSFVGAAHLVRTWVFERALADSLGAVRAVAQLVDPPPSPEENEWFPLFFPGSPSSVPAPEPSARLEPPSLPAPSPGRTQARTSLPQVQNLRPQSVRVSEELVLQWAEQQVVPQGKSVPADGNMPAGIELSGVAALGIGLREGDRLVRVAGVPVHDRGRVVGEVLAARGRKEGFIVAELVRATPQGPVPFTVTFSQPYPEPP